MRALVVLFLAALGGSACSGDDEPPPCQGNDCNPGASSSGGAETCPAGTRADALGACSDVGWHACGTRFVTDELGWDCAPPELGATCGGAACAPLGWTECGAGFELDASSWACRAVVPAEPCPAGTRAALGQTGCQPIGDCEAAFPPAAATMFVDDDFGPGDIDATHFASIAAALAAAPPGAVIAVEAGNYGDPLQLVAPVTLRGRCAEQVVLDGGGSGAPGLDVRDVATVSGVTVRGFSPGAFAQLGGELSLEASALVANETAGVLVADAGSSAHLSGCAVTGNLPTGNTFGQGAAAGFGGELLVEDSALSDNREHGVLVTGAGSHAELTRTVVMRTRPRESNGTLGLGIAVQEGGTLTVTDSAVLDNRVAGVSVLGAGSEAALSRTEVARTAVGPQDDGQVGVGVNAQQDAVLTVSETTIAESGQDGLRGWSGAAVAAERVSLLGNGTAGLWLEDAATVATLAASVIRGTVVARVADSDAASGALIGNGATLDAEDVLTEANAGSGMILFGAGTVVRAKRLLSRGNLPLAGGDFGFGISVEHGAVLELTDSAAVANTAVALHVSEAGSSATLNAVSLRASVPNAEGRRGRGANVQNGATLTATQLAVVDDTQAGLFAFGQGSAVNLQGALIHGTAMDSAGFGHAAMAVAGARLDLLRVTLQSSAGIAVAVAGATGTLASSLVIDNAVAIHVQDGSELAELDVLPSSVPLLQLAVTTDVAFTGNATRVGSGQVPLPEPLTPQPQP
jgi:hypothetical protein